MSDRAADPDLFIVYAPIWSIVIDAIYQKEGVPGGIAMGQSAQFGLVFPLFTDESLAQRFIDETGKPGRSVFKIEDSRVLLGLFNAMKIIGVRHAAFDCPADPNPRGEAGRYPTLDQVIAALRQSERS